MLKCSAVKCTACLFISGSMLFISLTSSAQSLDPPHDSASTFPTGCLTCHDMSAFDQPNLIPDSGLVPVDIDDTQYNNICWNCHDITGLGPLAYTHSSLLLGNKYGDWSVECVVCHNQHIQEQNRKNGSTYGKFIRTTIDLSKINGAGKTGSKKVVFTGSTGPNSFADGDGVYDGICEVCHTQTIHHQNSAVGDHAHYQNWNCMTVCHSHKKGIGPVEDSCLGCHAESVNDREAVGEQFAGNSHHIQTGSTITSYQCYQCHWESDDKGRVTSYHNATSSAPVDLVIRDNNVDGTPAARPATYILNTTAIEYTAGSSSALELNPHCLGCHNDDFNNYTTDDDAISGGGIFSDNKAPNQYAWDGSSIGARYSQLGTTTWGKYKNTANAAKKDIQKAFSAHGNAGANARGWDDRAATDGGTGIDGTIPNTSGSVLVACFDCHNSHGSDAGDATHPSTSFTSATTSGGILKNTEGGKGGYAMTYQPMPGGSTADKNVRNPGASLCLDCHLTQTAGTTPWGYSSTFGASQAIIGYFDSPYLAPGTTGTQYRYPYKGLTSNAGGHFGASSSLVSTPMHEINGLCTPCHDPHGVSPTNVGICSNISYVTKSDCQSGGGIWTATPQYGIPMLKGTWMTSPYKEDTAPANNTLGTVRDNTYPLGWDGQAREGVQYHIDQNTFGSNIKASVTGVTESAVQFAGLCLGCHSKSSLTNGVNGGTWKSVDRIHESVKNWGANVRHNYTCSKCHAPHNGSALPRLMITNCLNKTHKGRVGNNTDPKFSGSGDGDENGCYGESVTLGGCPTYPEDSFNFASGSGRFPGSFDGFYYQDNFGPNAFTVGCHENKTGSTSDQSWNLVTQWTPPSIIPLAATSIASTEATLGIEITSDGGSAITERGTLWGTSASTTDNELAEGSTGTGTFSQLRGTDDSTGIPMPSGAKIFYRGYAINSFGTWFSPEGSFYTEPAPQASAISFTSVTLTGMTVNWNRGGGDGVIVLMKKDVPVDSNPVDGTYTGYTGNSLFGSGTQIGTGNYVVYKGSGTSVPVTGLTPGSIYYVEVYEYSGTVNTTGVNQGTNYRQHDPPTDNKGTLPVPPVLILPTATSITSNTADLGADVISSGGQPITERGTIWSTAPNPVYPTDNAESFSGTTGIFSHERTGLNPGTKIYYRGYAINSEGTGYSPEGGFYTEPEPQASGASLTPAGSTAVVNWTRGGGDGVIVLMKLGGPVDSDPVDGIYTGYTDNSLFGNGTQIGTGNYVVYKGTGTGVTVTDLSVGATYYVAVYEYSGTVDTSGVNKGTNYRQQDAPSVSGTVSITPGNYSYTYDYLEIAGEISERSLYIPIGATNIQFTVMGAGGGGGRDDYDIGENGAAGHKVVSNYATTDIALSIKVGGGGQPGSTSDIGANGGLGYVNGVKGGDGEYLDEYCWGYGGAGGGGSSAIYSGGTPLAQAAGGAGGASGDWECAAGGAGGAGGGSDTGDTIFTSGGGTGGSHASAPTAGGNGQVVITFTIP